MNKTLQKVILYLISTILMLMFLYGTYWLAKNGSYYFWYESMVKNTIREMIKQEAIK